jgi:hypothetical protein
MRLQLTPFASNKLPTAEIVCRQKEKTILGGFVSLGDTFRLGGKERK